MDGKGEALMASQERIESSLALLRVSQAELNNSQAVMVGALTAIQRQLEALARGQASGVAPHPGTASLPVGHMKSLGVVRETAFNVVRETSTGNEDTRQQDVMPRMTSNTNASSAPAGDEEKDEGLMCVRASAFGEVVVAPPEEEPAGPRHSFFVANQHSFQTPKRTFSASEQVATAPMLPQAWPAKLAMRSQLQKWANDYQLVVARGHSRLLDLGESHSVSRMQGRRSARRTDDNDREERLFMQFLREPDTPMRQVFELFGFLLVVYDLVVTPYLLAWDAEHTAFVIGMDWCLVSFWTVDIGLSFVKGFHDDGEIVMGLRDTSRRYLRTWFLPDVITVLADWFVLVVMFSVGGWDKHRRLESAENGPPLLKFVKWARLVRILDVLRVVHLMRIFEAFVERHLSTGFRLMMRMLSLSGWVFFVNHCLACLWFAVGKYWETDTGGRWVDSQMHIRDDETGMEYLDTGVVYQYATALHWSMAQCTLSYMEVTPRNSAERVLVCICMFWGLFFGSMLFSILSANMVELRMLAQSRSEKISTLRRYLLENHVERKVALFVQRQVTERLNDRGRLTAKDVPALAILSTSARLELHAEITRPYLIRHPLFRLWDCIDSHWFQRLCTEAADLTFLRPGDDLFIAGILSSHAYYLIAGRLNYTQEPDYAPVDDVYTKAVEQGTWLCESALWSEWIHVGKAEAVTHSQLLVVSSAGMLKAVKGHRLIRVTAADYARSFHKRIITAAPPISTWPNDLEVPFTDYGEIVESLSRTVQITIGMIALDHLKPKRGRAQDCAKATEELRTEVEEGKSIIVLTASGEAERVVTVVVMYITRGDGKVLVQVGKWEAFQVSPDCQLPAVKCERNELTDDAAHRLLTTKLAPLVDRTQVVKIEREMSTRESKGFGVRTKYLRKVLTARLTQPVDMKECLSATVKPEFSRRSESLEFLENLRENKVHFFPHQNQKHDKGVFCAWLSPEDFENLQTYANEPVVQEWLQSLRPPMDAEASDSRNPVIATPPVVDLPVGGSQDLMSSKV